MITFFKNYWLIILLCLGVATCTVNAGYNAYQRKSLRAEKESIYNATIDQLKVKYKAKKLSEIKSGSDFTVSKQMLFNYPQNVIIEGNISDAYLSKGECKVLVGEFLEEDNFNLSYNNCKGLTNYNSIQDLLIVATITSHTSIDDYIRYNGVLLEIVEL